MKLIDPKSVPVEVRQALFAATRTAGTTQETIEGMPAVWTEGDGDRAFDSFEVRGQYLVTGSFQVKYAGGAEGDAYVVTYAAVTAHSLRNVEQVELAVEGDDDLYGVVSVNRRHLEVPQVIAQRVLLAG